MLRSAVALIIFNRPKQTAEVFETIRQAQPTQLFVIADGPREDRVGEAEKCSETRAIVKQVDWDCEVFRNYSEVNLGCKRRVSSGLDWVFSQVEEAIILEDDCLPNSSFFHFCEYMLQHYRNEEKIMMVSGTNYLEQWKPDMQSYHFSYYGGIWGWASWRRAWKTYDVDMKAWRSPDSQKRIKQVLADEAQFRARQKMLQLTYDQQIDTWDYQWSFARLLRAGLSVVPCVNLVSNIGFGEDATHTTGVSHLSELKMYNLPLPIQHQPVIEVDRDYDAEFFCKLDPPRSFQQRLKSKLRLLATR